MKSPLSRVFIRTIGLALCLGLLFAGCSSTPKDNPEETATVTTPQATPISVTPEPVKIAGNWVTSPVEDFSAGLTWSSSGGGFEIDSANFIQGDHSVVMTTQAQDEYVTISSAPDAYDIDLSGAYLRVTLRCEDITNFRMLNMIACSGGDYSNYYRWVLVPKSTGTGNSQNLITSGDWVTLSLSLSDALITGTPDASHITSLRIQAKDDGARIRLNIQKIETARYSQTAFPKGVVSIVFDDGRQSVYDTAKSMMDALGYKGTEFLITEYINNGLNGYLTWDEVKALQAGGWELGGHAGFKSTHGSTNGLIDLTDQEIRADFEQIITDFSKNGLGTPTGFAYPKGDYDSRVEAIAKEYFQYARTVNKCTGIETAIPGELFRLRALSAITSYSSGNTVESVTGEGGLLDDCATGGWAILVFHDITPGDAENSDQCSAADFQKILDAIASRGLTVLPISQVLQAVDVK